MRALLVFLVLLEVGCGAGAANLPPGLRLTRSRCGKCHAPPAPGVKPRAELGPILERHVRERRVRLDDAERQQIIDALGR